MTRYTVVGNKGDDIWCVESFTVEHQALAHAKSATLSCERRKAPNALDRRCVPGARYRVIACG